MSEGGSDNFVLQWKCILISVGQRVFASNVLSLFKDWFVWLFKKNCLEKHKNAFRMNVSDCLRSLLCEVRNGFITVLTQKNFKNINNLTMFIPKAWTDRCLVYNKRMKTFKLKQNDRLNECIPLIFSLSRSSWLRFSLAVRYSWNSLKPIDWNMPCW